MCGALRRGSTPTSRPTLPGLEKFKDTSRAALVALGINRRRFDLVYIDGSHRPTDAYADGVLAWPLLRSKGTMIFDDYEWASRYSPRPGIDAFLSLTDHQVVSRGYQMIVSKP